MIDMKLANLAVIQIDVADIKDRLTRIEIVLEQHCESARQWSCANNGQVLSRKTAVPMKCGSR
jgi:hypothetical protein